MAGHGLALALASGQVCRLPHGLAMAWSLGLRPWQVMAGHGPPCDSTVATPDALMQILALGCRGMLVARVESGLSLA